MKKLLIFDLDGVLLDCKEIHQDSFISSWNSLYPLYNINSVFHSKFLDGMNTYGKINYLENYFKIHTDRNKIFEIKQINTIKGLNNFNYTTRLINVFNTLQKDYLLACASNSIKTTVNLILTKLNIINYFNLILSNEDVQNPKPNPEIYLKTMKLLNIQAENTYIFEDSNIGLEAAHNSGANVIRIYDSKDLNLKFLEYSIQSKMRYKPWFDNKDWKLRIVIPMAGEGIRFKNAGYLISKPFIPIKNKPMIQWVLDNLNTNNQELQSRIEYHLCVRSEYVEQLKHIDNITIHPILSLTEGAVSTVLTLENILLDSNPLLIVNSDQYLEWNFDEFIETCLNPEFDGCISTFYNPDKNDTKWSFAKLNNDGYVEKVAEKEYISHNATTGIYFWKEGKKFVKYSKEMIQKNDRVNNEFYVCPVYNYLINDNGKVRISECKKIWGLGIPEDLAKFKQEYLYET